MVLENRVRYPISQKGGTTYVFFHNFARIKIDSHDPLPLGKTLTLDNIIILITSVVNQNQNHYYYNIFLEKCSSQSPKIMTKNFLYKL